LESSLRPIFFWNVSHHFEYYQRKYRVHPAPAYEYQEQATGADHALPVIVWTLLMTLYISIGKSPTVLIPSSLIIDPRQSHR